MLAHRHHGRGVACASLDEVEPTKRRFTVKSTAQMTAWLELFYDLVFVAAILVLSDAITYVERPGRVLSIVAVFASLWWIWLQTMLFTNRFRVHDMTHRVLVLVQMFVVILITMQAHEGVIRDAEYLSVTYAVLLGTVAIMYWRRARHGGDGARYARARSTYLIAAAVVFAASAALPVARGVAWAAAIVLSAGPFRVARNAEATPVPRLDEHHLIERMGALTIIVCGEAFVKVAIVVSAGAIEEVDVLALAFQCILTFAIWLSYFEDIPHAGLRRSRRVAWIALHLGLQLGIAGTAIGVSQFIRTDPFDPLATSEILAITGSLATVYLALALLSLCTRRVPVGPLLVLRLATGVAVVVVGLTAWLLPSIDLVVGVAALTVVAVVHALLAVRLDAETTVADPV
jgi:low temperature requirement protein LtrA